VIAIMAVLLGVGAMAFSGSRSGRVTIRQAENTIRQMIENGRATAISSGSTVRLLLADDPSVTDQMFRRMLLVRSTDTADPTSGSAIWKQIGTHVDFPDNIFADLSSMQPPSGAVVIPQVMYEPSTGIEGQGTTWLEFRFLPDGSSAVPGARLIATTGILDESSASPTVLTDPEQRVGCIVRKNGRPTTIESPSQL